MSRIDPNRQHSRGFTLVEVIVVVAIIGILMAVAVPSYRDHLSRTRRVDCQGVLSNLAIAMERHFAANDTYAGTSLGNGDDDLFPDRCPLETETTTYTLSITESTATTYQLQATPVGVQAGDGLLTLDHTGRRGWDQNGNNVIDTGENTWDIR